MKIKITEYLKGNIFTYTIENMTIQEYFNAIVNMYRNRVVRNCEESDCSVDCPYFKGDNCWDYYVVVASENLKEEFDNMKIPMKVYYSKIMEDNSFDITHKTTKEAIEFWKNKGLGCKEV